MSNDKSKLKIILEFNRVGLPVRAVEIEDGLPKNTIQVYVLLERNADEESLARGALSHGSIPEKIESVNPPYNEVPHQLRPFIQGNENYDLTYLRIEKDFKGESRIWNIYQLKERE